MIRFENTEVFNFAGALRGMRNAKNSWDKSDSGVKEIYGIGYQFVIGENDMKLAQNLIGAGSDHRKFMRQIFVSVDIIAPLYWWKEFDTYKVGTVANSCSTMHKIHSKPIEMSDFSFDNSPVEDFDVNEFFRVTVKYCEDLRLKYLLYTEKANKCTDLEMSKYYRQTAKAYWRALIQLLPESYNQRRTVTLNYETLRNVYGARRNHKLTEWSEVFIDWIKSLPYANELIMYKQ